LPKVDYPTRVCLGCGNTFLLNTRDKRGKLIRCRRYCGPTCTRLSNKASQRRAGERKKIADGLGASSTKPTVYLRKNTEWFTVFGEQKLGYPSGHYVYGWYDNQSDLPFYVGQGYWNRAWSDHGDAWCERYRSKRTRVVIYRWDLTKEGALLGESILTNLFKGLGASLTNAAETMKRKEVPPLERSEDPGNL
jgi:hypothetical protein